ncbi:MAG: hypothetical protein GWN64_09535 [Candidatus Thorarchaeota archaeon]|nr:hypothetical protein [Candidatus Thorarchaeota archaeon]
MEQFTRNFLDHAERIQKPILYAESVTITDQGNPMAAEPKGKLRELRDVYCINTNKRMLFASTGITTSTEVEEVEGNTGIVGELWKEVKGAKVLSEVSHGYTFYSVQKDEVQNTRFQSGMTARTEFLTAKVFPFVISVLLGLFGFILLMLGLAGMVGLSLLGGVSLLLAIVLYLHRTMEYSSPIQVDLGMRNSLIVVFKNSVDISKMMQFRGGSMELEEINSEYTYLFLSIQFSEAVTTQELREFIVRMKTKK